MDCTKCEYSPTGDFKKFDEQSIKDIDVFYKKCVNCNIKFPWLEESQFKAKDTK